MGFGDTLVFYDQTGKNSNENAAIDFALDLPTGASLAASGHTVTHVPAPSGTPQTPTPVVSGTKIVWQMTAFDVLGWHKFRVLALYSGTTPANLKKEAFLYLKVIDPAAPA